MRPRPRRRMRVGEPVDEPAGSGDRVVERARGGREPERPVAGRGALRGDDDVRPDAPVVEAEPGPGPPEAGHHLVGDQEHAVAPADLGDPRPVVIRWDGGRQCRADDRLGDECRDAGRLFRQDRPLQLVGELGAGGEGVRRLLTRPVRIRRGHVAKASEPRLVRPAERGPAGQVEGAQRVAVVAAPAGDHDRPLRLTAGEVVRPGELQRRLGRLGAAADRVDRRICHRQARPDLGGVRLEGLGGERRAVGIGETANLLREHAGDGRPPVTDVDDDRAARRVQVLAARGVADRGTVRLDGDRQIEIERPPEDPAGPPCRLGHAADCRVRTACGLCCRHTDREADGPLTARTTE